MHEFKVFLQQLDNSFIEIAQTRYLNDAELVLTRQPSGMISRKNGEIVTTKNLKSEDTPTLFHI